MSFNGLHKVIINNKKFDIKTIAAICGIISAIVSGIWGLHEMSHRDENSAIATNRSMILDNKRVLDSMQHSVNSLMIKVAKIEAKANID